MKVPHEHSYRGILQYNFVLIRNFFCGGGEGGLNPPKTIKLYNFYYNHRELRVIEREHLFEDLWHFSGLPVN